MPVDRTPRSTRTEVGDTTETEGSERLIKFLRDHGTGSVPDHYYDPLPAGVGGPPAR